MNELPTENSYILFDPKLSIKHDAFTVYNLNMVDVGDLCGPPVYSASFNGVQLSATSAPVSYSTFSRTFGLYSEDPALIPEITVELYAYLSTNVNVASETVAMQIEIVDPCIDHFKLVVPAQTAPPVYLYASLALPSVVFTPKSVEVIPYICPLDFACQGVRDVNICEIADDGVTSSMFDAATGTLKFSTFDIVQYPPGTYSVEITALSGSKSESF